MLKVNQFLDSPKVNYEPVSSNSNNYFSYSLIKDGFLKIQC